MAEYKGRCMKCKKEVKMKDAAETVMKNGMKAAKGKCPTCGTNVFRILGKADAGAKPAAAKPSASAKKVVKKK